MVQVLLAEMAELSETGSVLGAILVYRVAQEHHE